MNSARFLVCELVISSCFVVYGAPVTTVTCTATAPNGSVIVTDTNTDGVCSYTGDLPGFPGIRAYRVSALATPTHIETSMNSGIYNLQGSPTSVTAAASVDFSDLVTFAGEGNATLRVTLYAEQIGRDGVDSYTYEVEDDRMAANIKLPGLDAITYTTHDFDIDRGVPIHIAWHAHTTASAMRNNTNSSGINFSVFSFRIYDAAGNPLNGLQGLGADGLIYESIFGPNDTAPGPSTPEPSTMALALVALVGYCVRKGITCSLFPHAT